MVHHYNVFELAVRNLHQSNTFSNAGEIDQVLRTVTEWRWNTLPRWVQDSALSMAYEAAGMDPMLRMRRFKDSLFKQIAWYERQVWAINEYTRFHGRGNRLPASADPLFATFPADDLPLAFPLLPFSQQYTPLAYHQAVDCLSTFIEQQHHAYSIHADRSQPNLRTSGEDCANIYAHIPSEDRHTLSLKIWNAFVCALWDNDLKPDIAVLFSHQLPYYKRPSLGGASALLPSCFVAPPPFPTGLLDIDFPSGYFNNIISDVVLNAKHHGAVTPAAAPGLAANLHRGITRSLQRLGMAEFGKFEGLALAREFEAVWAQTPLWGRDKFPDVGYIFECLNPTPLSEVCRPQHRPQHPQSTQQTPSTFLQAHYQNGPGNSSGLMSLGEVRRRFGRGRAGRLDEASGW